MRGHLFWLLAVGACGTSSDASSWRTFDACETNTVDARAATDAQLASVDDGIALWADVGVHGLVHAPSASIDVVFRDAPNAIYGFYDDAKATVYVNTRLDEQTARAITIAHELGHAFGLVHVAASERFSVMNPGNLTTPPTAEDAAQLVQIWGDCSAR